MPRNRSTSLHDLVSPRNPPSYNTSTPWLAQSAHTHTHTYIYTVSDSRCVPDEPIHPVRSVRAHELLETPVPHTHTEPDSVSWGLQQHGAVGRLHGRDTGCLVLCRVV